MRNEIELEAIIEDYLDGKLSAEEHQAFEQLRSTDPTVDHKVVTHKVFMESIKQYADMALLKQRMDAAHDQIDVASISEQVKPHSSRIVRLWRNNRSAIAVAASFLVLATIMLLSVYAQQAQVGNFEQLKNDVSDIKTAQSNIVRTIREDVKAKPDVRPAKFGGTGFAISTNGYIVTSFHVIDGAKSLYVQNSEGASFKVIKYYMNPEKDIAVLKIDDPSFTHLSTLPYSLKKGMTGLGDAVYTLGYPKEDVVLGDGYVSSKTGFNGDTSAYQVAIPVNPGNSGGPLLDNNGNVVGVINGKESKTDGAAFAIKSKYILEALNAIPQDSLRKKVSYGKRSSLQGLTRSEQAEKMAEYVFMIKAY